MRLTARQRRFVDEYTISRNASQAAREAGYSEHCACVIGYENLRKPAISAAIAEREAELSQRLELRKDDVVAGLLQAVSMAQEQLEPGAMVRAWAEIGKMLGFCAPEAVKVEVSDDTARLQAKMAAMSDGELMALTARQSPVT